MNDICNGPPIENDIWNGPPIENDIWNGLYNECLAPAAPYLYLKIPLMSSRNFRVPYAL